MYLRQSQRTELRSEEERPFCPQTERHRKMYGFPVSDGGCVFLVVVSEIPATGRNRNIFQHQTKPKHEYFCIDKLQLVYPVLSQKVADEPKSATHDNHVRQAMVDKYTPHNSCFIFLFLPVRSQNVVTSSSPFAHRLVADFAEVLGPCEHYNSGPEQFKPFKKIVVKSPLFYICFRDIPPKFVRQESEISKIGYSFCSIIFLHQLKGHFISYP